MFCAFYFSIGSDQVSMLKKIIFVVLPYVIGSAKTSNFDFFLNILFWLSDYIVVLELQLAIVYHIENALISISSECYHLTTRNAKIEENVDEVTVDCMQLINDLYFCALLKQKEPALLPSIMIGWRKSCHIIEIT